MRLYGFTEARIYVNPQFRNLLGGVRSGIEFASGAAINHRRCEIRPLVKNHRGNRAVLGKSNGCIRGDAGSGGGAIEDKDHRLRNGFHQIDGRSNRSQIMRAWARRDEDEIRDADNCGDRGCDRWRGVDDHQFDAGVLKGVQMARQFTDVNTSKQRGLGNPNIPPRCQTALWVGVHQSHRSGALRLGFDSEMPADRGLADPTFL